MKNALLFAAIAMMTVPAMASKARLIALNNASHLQDIQQIFTNASLLSVHGDWVTFEMGANPGSNVNTTTPTAEGGFSRAMNDSKYGFYLGHHSAFAGESRLSSTTITGKTYLTDENAVNLFYAHKADLNWGVGLNYANSDKKSLGTKQSALGVNAGVSSSLWDAGLDVGLTNTFKQDTLAGTAVADFTGKTAIGLNGRYFMDTMTFSALYSINGGKDQVAPESDFELNHFNLGVENSHKTEGADFFYGIKYAFDALKNKAAGGDKKSEMTSLPVYAGIEADAASWLVLRASVTQNFLLGSTKNEFATTGESNTISNNTVVAAGAGLKFNKLQLDGTFAKASGGSATGALNSSDLLANASLTYMF